MARILIVYHRTPEMAWRSTYSSHLYSFERHSDDECYYLNTARSRVPSSIAKLKPDAVIFHYTFLAMRQVPALFETLRQRIGFLKDNRCPKALVPHDEQTHSDLLCTLAEEFGVTHVFTPAMPSEWPKIYEGVHTKLTFHTVLTGYVDETTMSAIAKRSNRGGKRPIDVGYRSWDAYPFYGRHGQLKGEIGRLFKQRGPEAGLIVDISSSYKDALLGNSWFDFLLDCRYTIGVEGGSSVLDRDGSIAERSRGYMANHPDASFEEVEAACFPGADGGFDYRLLGPRHLEAVMTRTCQVLVEGDYGGVLLPELHYLELKRDFSNIDSVLDAMHDEGLRTRLVERAYEDVVASGAFSYQALVDLVLQGMLGQGSARTPQSIGGRLAVVRNKASERIWMLWFWPYYSVDQGIRRALRPTLSRLIGEERLRSLLQRIRGKSNV